MPRNKAPLAALSVEPKSELPDQAASEQLNVIALNQSESFIFTDLRKAALPLSVFGSPKKFNLVQQVKTACSKWPPLVDALAAVRPSGLTNYPMGAKVGSNRSKSDGHLL